MIQGLDLFSGCGGITLALRPWVRPIAYCENDRYCQSQLLSRVESGDLPYAPIWDDVRTLRGSYLPTIDIIYGGFPCQDISVAGLAKGLGGERSGLFSEILRLAKEAKPTFVFLENVPAIRTRGLSTVVRELASIGYDSRWCTVSAAQVGAPHRRDRWFLLAHSHSQGLRGEAIAGSQKDAERGWEDHGWPEATAAERDWWATEPQIPRVDDGTTFRMDRARQLGNGVVPQAVRTAFQALSGLAPYHVKLSLK